MASHAFILDVFYNSWEKYRTPWLLHSALQLVANFSCLLFGVGWVMCRLFFGTLKKKIPENSWHKMLTHDCIFCSKTKYIDFSFQIYVRANWFHKLTSKLTTLMTQLTEWNSVQLHSLTSHQVKYSYAKGGGEASAEAGTEPGQTCQHHQTQGHQWQQKLAPPQVYTHTHRKAYIVLSL